MSNPVVEGLIVTARVVIISVYCLLNADCMLGTVVTASHRII